MALMKAALAWERFVLKDVTRFAALAKVQEDNIEMLRSTDNISNMSQVELVPSADVGGMLKGVGNLTKDALTFKWAQVLLKIGPLLNSLSPGHHEGCGCEHCCCHRDCLLVLHWGVHR